MNAFASDVASNFANYLAPPTIPPNDNPRGDNFNVSSLVREIIGGLTNAIKQNATLVNKVCIDQQGLLVIRSNKPAIDAMVKDIVVVRNVTAVFNRIEQSIVNITRTISALVPPNNQCVNALLKLTCSKCQKTIPKLCRNVCSAVARGCYAPYAVVLDPQFNILWNVTSQLANLLVNSIADLFMQQGNIRQALVRWKG